MNRISHQLHVSFVLVVITVTLGSKVGNQIQGIILLIDHTYPIVILALSKHCHVLLHTAEPAPPYYPPQQQPAPTVQQQSVS